MKPADLPSIADLQELFELVTEVDRRAEVDARAVEAHRIDLAAVDRRVRLRRAAASREVHVPLDVAIVPAEALARQSGRGVHAWYLVSGDARLLSFVNLGTTARGPENARNPRTGRTCRLIEADAGSAEISAAVSLPELHDGARFYRFSPAPEPGEALVVRLAGSANAGAIDVLWSVPGALPTDPLGEPERAPGPDDELTAPARDLRRRMNTLVTAYQAAIRYRARLRHEAEGEEGPGRTERVPGTVTKPFRAAVEALFERFQRLPPWARITLNWYACELVRCFNPATFEGFGLLALAAQPGHALPGFQEALRARRSRAAASRG